MDAVNPLLRGNLSRWPAGDEALRRMGGVVDAIEPETIRKLADYGVTVRLHTERPADWGEHDRGTYSEITRDIGLLRDDVLGIDETTLRLFAFHEILGHALTAQRNFGHGNHVKNRLKLRLHGLVKGLLGKSLKREVRAAEWLYRNFQLRARATEAIIIHLLLSAVEALPAGSDGQVEFGGRLVDREAVRAAMITQLNGDLDVKILEAASGPDGTARVSFERAAGNQYLREMSRSSGTVLKAGGFALAVGAILAATGSHAAGAILGGCGLVTMTLPGLPWLSARGGTTDTRLALPSGGEIAIRQRGNRIDATFPATAENPKWIWDDYALSSNDEEEYLAQGIAAFNNAPETREHLRRADPGLHDYIAGEFGPLVTE